MQKIITPLLVVLVIGLITAGLPLNKSRDAEKGEGFDNLKEQKALLALIDKETASFYKKDIDLFAACWAHGSYVRNMGWWKRGGINVISGWDSLSQFYSKMVADNPKPNPEKRIRKNYNFRIAGNMAWCTFDEYGKDNNDPSFDMPGLVRATRIFEKQNGVWKIVYVGWLLNG